METEVFCWPCFGIVTNLSSDSSNVNPDCHNSDYWKRKFSEFKPLNFSTVLNADQSIDKVVVAFKSDWSGFKNAMEFDKLFEARGRGREEWIQRKTSPGSRLYAWVAREDDYISDGPLGEFLRGTVGLKTFTELVQEATTNRGKILCELLKEIELKNKNLNQLRTNFLQNRMSAAEMLGEQQKMFLSLNEATTKLQCITKEHIAGVVEEQEMLKFELESKRKRLGSWREDLSNCEEAVKASEGRIREAENMMVELIKREESLVKLESRIAEQENIKSDLTRRMLQMATEERRKADENVGILTEVRKREKEAVEKVLELERKLGEKHKLETEIEELKDQKNGVQNLYQDLMVSERQCNDELQGSREELMKGLSSMKIGHRSIFGIKRMGEIDPKAFKNTCNQRFSPEDAETKALELCSLWQERLKDPMWHPFRVTENDSGIHQRLVNEDDELLRGLKNEWGDEIYDAVVTALKELQEYNPSGCYLVSEFWNFKENRKATMKEVIGYVCTQLNKLKRKRS